ncbi:TPA: hypothetical protein RVS02_001625 [Aeromonas veronii]|nr:hypothetical protein [Aeromonas veronii]
MLLIVSAASPAVVGGIDDAVAAATTATDHGDTVHPRFQRELTGTRVDIKQHNALLQAGVAVAREGRTITKWGHDTLH